MAAVMFQAPTFLQVGAHSPSFHNFRSITEYLMTKVLLDDAFSLFGLYFRRNSFRFSSTMVDYKANVHFMYRFKNRGFSRTVYNFKPWKESSPNLGVSHHIEVARYARFTILCRAALLCKFSEFYQVPFSYFVTVEIIYELWRHAHHLRHSKEKNLDPPLMERER